MMEGQIYLENLERTINDMNLPKNYSIHKFLEDTIAICQIDNIWEVFIYSNHQKYYLKKFETCKEACFQMIDLLCLNDKKRRKAHSYYSLNCFRSYLKTTLNCKQKVKEKDYGI